MGVFEIQALLTSSGVRGVDLDAAASMGVLQPKHYMEVLEERSVEGKCGWPLCRQALPNDAARSSSVNDQPTAMPTFGRVFCSDTCAAASKSFLRKLEDSVHFSSTEKTSATLDDVLQSIAVAVDEEDSHGLVAELGIPPFNTNPALTSSGRVIEISHTDISGEVAGGKVLPKRLKQLRRRIAEDSVKDPGDMTVQSVDERMQLMEITPMTSIDTGLKFSSVSSGGGAQITFAALNYGGSTKPTPKPKPVNKTKNIDSDKFMTASTQIMMNKGVDALNPVRASKVVSWGEDVKESVVASNKSKMNIKPPPAAMAKAASKDVVLVGQVVEKVGKPRPIIGVVSAHSAARSIEGYSSSMEKTIVNKRKGDLPRRQEIYRDEYDEDGDDDNFWYEGGDEDEDVGFPDSDTDGGEDDGEDVMMEEEEDDDDDNHEDTPLNLFSSLWLVSDDVFGMLLPLNMHYGGNMGDGLDPALSIDAEFRRLHPELALGLGSVETRLGLTHQTRAVQEAYCADLDFVKRALLRPCASSTCMLQAGEWEVMALLLVDGLLRRRGWSDDAMVLTQMTLLAGTNSEALSDREVYHLRSAFCPLD
jgi:hypothetical protein